MKNKTKLKDSEHVKPTPFSAFIDYSGEQKDGWKELSNVILNKFNPKHQVLNQEIKKKQEYDEAIFDKDILEKPAK